MNEAVLLAACDEAPNDPLPRLALADCLEEAGTPGRAAVGRLVRRSAKLLENRTPAAQGALTRERNRLSKERPAAVGWFQWWFDATVLNIVGLHDALDRRRLARFMVRCARETPTRLGGVVVDHAHPSGLAVIKLLDRFAGGTDLTEADWRSTEGFLPAGLRQLWKTYVSSPLYVGLGSDIRDAVAKEGLAVADPEVPIAQARWAAASASAHCAAAFGEGWDEQLPARELHRRLLHECVSCPFDPEGDG
jgi:uncharacterized protein (TIGR02996 family)